MTWKKNKTNKEEKYAGYVLATRHSLIHAHEKPSVREEEKRRTKRWKNAYADRIAWNGKNGTKIQ